MPRKGAHDMRHVQLFTALFETFAALFVFTFFPLLAVNGYLFFLVLCSPPLQIFEAAQAILYVALGAGGMVVATFLITVEAGKRKPLSQDEALFADFVIGSICALDAMKRSSEYRLLSPD